MENNKIDGCQSDTELVEQLATACLGLVWSSESDFPWQVICRSDTNSLDSRVLLQHYNYAPETKIETTTLESFLAPATQVQKWHNQSERNQTHRYQLLQKLLQENLSEVRVYLVGEVTIDVYILGIYCDRLVVGLSTKIVAT